MKVLYGVQGTGNGHITRARGMVKHMAAYDIQADFVFSGRPPNKFNDMEPFGDWRHLTGLTFATSHGRIKPLGTMLNFQPGQLLRDIRELAVNDYDLVISDFEPVTAWAAQRQNKPCLGIGHQYAFDYPIPKTGGNPVTHAIMRWFAPTTHSIGMHWYHFNQPIVPPIVDVWDAPVALVSDMILVYLPFEDPADVLPLLQPLQDYRFVYYGHFAEESQKGNVTMKPICRQGFQRDLAQCNGVISNAGFELASEAISLGKRLLAKPLRGQMEQLSNGLALEQLGLGQSVHRLSVGTIQHWLHGEHRGRVHYPDTARHLVEWIARGYLNDKHSLVTTLWQQTTAEGVDTFFPYPVSRAA